MGMKAFTIQSNESGDWFRIVDQDGTLWCDGHRPSLDDIKFLFENLGYKAERVELTDTEMEGL